MITDYAGKRFGCHQEALVATRYPDGRGRDASWGFGTLATGPNTTITFDEAFREAAAHYRNNDVWMDQHIKVPLPQNQWNAFASFYYQNGNKQNGRDIIVAAINSGDPEWYEGLINFDMNSKGEHKSGLRRRREREIALAKNGDYGDIKHYGVYAGTPPTFVEWRLFPVEEPQP